jgi:hypothetical protein
LCREHQYAIECFPIEGRFRNQVDGTRFLGTDGFGSVNAIFKAAARPTSRVNVAVPPAPGRIPRIRFKSAKPR